MSQPVSNATITSLSPPLPLGPLASGDPCTLVIFGAAGDLARRKLFPALYELARKKLVATDFRVLGVGIESFDDASFRAEIRGALGRSEDVKKIDEDVWGDLASRLEWLSGNLTEPAIYQAVGERLAKYEEGILPSAGNRLFYLAVPPSIFAPIVGHLSSSGVAPRVTSATAKPWRRVIVEKPFGHDLASARELGKCVLGAFEEHQVYRIDHYVGKETVQNVLVFRSANAIFEALWSREYVSHVEITAAETVGLEGRAKYYEQSGVVRDMFQNHLLQLVALTAMEPPENPSANAVRDEKVKVLRAIKPLVHGDKAAAVRAQYSAGSIHGEPVPGYREEPQIAAGSVTPTFAALRLEIDTDRWRGVPFFVRSGKRLAKRVSEVAVFFKPPKRLMYEPCPGEVLAPNVLVLRVQPDDGVSLAFEVKVPGAALALTPGIEVTPVEMDFSYANVFGTESHPAYETLLLDCMIGDQALFTRTDEVEAAWQIVDPLLDFWKHSTETSIPTYAAGSFGPEEANALLGSFGSTWRDPSVKRRQ